jgi:hypothetical protein
MASTNILFQILYGGGFPPMLDILDLFLTIIGMIPALGLPADIAAAFISFIQGDIIGVILSIINAIPIAGTASAPLKILKKIVGFL